MWVHTKLGENDMKKKILSTLLVAAMTISMLAGCGGNNAGDPAVLPYKFG